MAGGRAQTLTCPPQGLYCTLTGLQSKVCLLHVLTQIHTPAVYQVAHCFQQHIMLILATEVG